MSSFANRVVLITGAGSGLGRQLALILAGEGAAIGAVDLHGDALAKLAAELPGKPLTWAVGDVTDRAALEIAVRQVREKLGPVDVLIANAGIGRETSALAFNAEDFETVIRVNLIGVANSIAAVLPDMLERRRGHIVGISSLASFRGFPRMAAYCASKSGVNALLDGFRCELKGQGIRVTTICPGWILTPMTVDLEVSMPDRLEVDDAARRIVEAMRRGRSFFAFPRSSARRAGLLRWLPCGLSDWLVRRVYP